MVDSLRSSEWSERKKTRLEGVTGGIPAEYGGQMLDALEFHHAFGYSLIVDKKPLKMLRAE